MVPVVPRLRTAIAGGTALDKDIVRQVVGSLNDLSARAATLRDDSNLYDAGLSSFGAAELMIELEAAFGIEFPRRMLSRDTFGSIDAIAAAIAELRAAAPADAAMGAGR
ncbi:acyl carrier protein [Paracraurococcus ruber]|uniref:Carrier domain-containing protein n=1 Tax=Paracraurococcus ruber TaxID=77675 RepID=A0ABS1CR53_9PROT|nr:acyl carrier protein [Paracraurococcus ruber]MBK1656924.1 hypothetical protein [Paracraurococcus ruber]TDG33285.1 acyl carrier protein [Paracraurococcus ruber]